VKSVLKSVHNHRRYLHFCDRYVCSIKYAATQRLQLRAWPILCTGLRPVQLFLVSIGPTRLIKFPIYLRIFFFRQQSFVTSLMHSVVNFGSLIDLWRAAYFYFVDRMWPAGRVFETPAPDRHPFRHSTNSIS